MRLRKEQMARYKRYLMSYFRHITLRKVCNLLKVEYKLARNNPDLRNLFPYVLFVEISNVCNLRCPVCQMGQKRIVPRKNLMSIDNYMSLITPLKDYLFQVFLYDWGEPFFNRDIYEIIEFNTSQNIGTVVSSNLNMSIDAKRLVQSGLDHLIISGDGITQEVYEKYRVGGKIDRVLDNLKKLVKAKQEAHSTFPYIEWQCLVHKWNESQLEKIENTVMSLGADEVRFCQMNFFAAEDPQKVEEEWLPQNPQYRVFSSKALSVHKAVRRPCYWLWRTAIVNVNGGITPCCLFDIPDWGNAFDEPFLSVWNNKKYTEARMRSQESNQIRKIKLICDNCNAPFIYK